MNILILLALAFHSTFPLCSNETIFSSFSEPTCYLVIACFVGLFVSAFSFFSSPFRAEVTPFPQSLVSDFPSDTGRCYSFPISVFFFSPFSEDLPLFSRSILDLLLPSSVSFSPLWFH